MARIPGSETILEAAEDWKHRCLLNGGSMLSEEPLWTNSSFDELVKEYVRKDKLAKKFWDSLKLQLENASPTGWRLFAELIWVYYLIPSSVKAETKRNRIREFWQIANGGDLSDQRLLHDVLERGVVHLGNSAGDIAVDFSFFISVMNDWFSRSLNERKEILSDPWIFADWLDRQEQNLRPALPSKPPFRHTLLFLLFPNEFEAIINRGHKTKIIENFFRKWNKECNIDKRSDNISIDRALLEVRTRVRREYPNGEESFYRTPLGEVWLEENSPSPMNKSHRMSQVAMVEASVNTILFGSPGTGKTYATFRRCVRICGEETEGEDEEIHARYAKLVEEGRVEFVTFHQSYGYEEFVEGLRPETVGSAGFELRPRDGVLKRIADRARNDESSRPHVLVIDEINRGNISKVFGEAITLLEEDKREGEENEVAATLPYSGDRFALPPNLYILGTMNTADRSIALLDTALRRRFDFEELPPKPELLKEAAERSDVDLPKVLSAMNERLEWYLGRDHLIGHAWLMAAEDRKSIDHIMRHKIIPMLAEYFHDDWSKIRAVLGGGDEFIARKKLKTPPEPDNADAGEDRYRWTVREEFPDDAYARLIAGKSRQTDAQDAGTENDNT